MWKLEREGVWLCSHRELGLRKQHGPGNFDYKSCFMKVCVEGVSTSASLCWYPPPPATYTHTALTPLLLPTVPPFHAATFSST